MDKKKKLLSFEDLYNFYVQYGHDMCFSSEESGYQLAVQVPMEFSTVDEYEDGTAKFYSIRAFHLLRNRNGSSVVKSAADKAMKNMAYKPVLANFVTYTDPKTKEDVTDFSSHDMTWVEDENEENGGHFDYIERQIGCFTADEPYYEEANDKTYICARICIPNEYTCANEIIERKQGTKMSVELLVNELSYNAQERVMELTDIDVRGITCLGTRVDEKGNPHDVAEGMEGSGISLEDFSLKNNSCVVDYSENDKLIEVLEKLDTTLNSLNDKSSNEGNDDGKGGTNILNKFEELLEQYGKTVEDIEFEYEGLTDEELEAAFAEAFTEGEDEDNDPEDTPDDGADGAEENGEDEPEDEGDGAEPEDNEPTSEDEGDEPDESDEPTEYSQKFTVEKPDGTVSTYEVALDEQIYALQQLVNTTYSESDNAYYGVKVYSDYVVMIDYWTGAAYRQTYTTDDDNYTLTGDRVSVKAKYVTAEEEAALEEMQSNYSSISEKLNAYEVAEARAEKLDVLADDDYAEFADTAEFADLAKDVDNYSLEEFKTQADVVFAKLVRAQGTFSAKHEKKTHNKVNYALENPIEKKPYGNLFN